MKVARWVGGILLLLVGIYAALFAAVRANNRAVRAELQAHYDDYARAVKARDADAVLRYYDRTMLPTWTVTLPGGTVIPLEKQKRFVREGGKFTRAVERYEVEVERASVLWRSAVATYTISGSTLMVDRKGRPYRQTMRNTLRSVWAYTPQGWKCGRTVAVVQNGRSHWVNEKKAAPAPPRSKAPS